MNVAELERLGINIWSDFGAYNEGGYYVSVDDAAHLARRVIAAEKLVGTLSYLQTQAENGTLHPKVVIQNARESITAYEATK